MLRNFFATVAVGSLFVGGLAASHLAFAQDGGPGPRGMRGGPMMMADANKDGTITKAELTASLEARFAQLDANKDGKLTKDEAKVIMQFIGRGGSGFGGLGGNGNRGGGRGRAAFPFGGGAPQKP